MADEVQPEPRWCVVGNVVAERLHGEDAELRQGAKSFPGGAKVYYHSAFWGMGAQSLTVVGLSRRPRRWIKISVQSSLVENWRAKLVHTPRALGELEGDDIRGDEAKAREMAEALNAVAAFYARRLAPRAPDACRAAAAEVGAPVVAGPLSADTAQDEALAYFLGTRAVAGVVFQAADPVLGERRQSPFICRDAWSSGELTDEFVDALQRRYPWHDLSGLRALIGARA